MAPTKKDTKADRNHHNQSDVASEHDQNGAINPGSQAAEDFDFIRMAEQLRKSIAIRGQNRRQKIRQEYTSAMNALSNDIITAYDGESKRISKSYKTKAKNLNAIFKRRASIEQNIAASIERLNSAYILAAKGLQVTVSGRIRVAADHDGAAESPKAAA